MYVVRVWVCDLVASKHRGRAGDCRPATASNQKNLKSKIKNRSPGARPGLVVHRSTTRRVAETRLKILAVLDDAGHGRVTARVGEHLCAAGAVVMPVVLC